MCTLEELIIPSEFDEHGYPKLDVARIDHIKRPLKREDNPEKYDEALRKLTEWFGNESCTKNFLDTQDYECEVLYQIVFLENNDLEINLRGDMGTYKYDLHRKTREMLEDGSIQGVLY